MSLDAPQSGWERRMARTHAALAGAAVELFTTRGYAASSVDDIARTAGVSRRTFFRYFASKEEVLLRPMRTVVDDFASDLARRPDSENVLASLRAVCDAWARHAVHVPLTLRLYRAIRAESDLRGTVSTFLAALEDAVAAWAGARLDLPADDLDVRLLAALTVAVRETAMRRWSQLDAAVPLADLLDEGFQHVATGWDPTAGDAWTGSRTVSPPPPP